ncbi:MAG TPA: guanylate kinase [Acidobacteriota bacterium]|nr:guanylate kinase [Acidobacteriota bacterium]
MSDDAPFCFVVSAPSGAGKTTLADAVLDRVDRLKRTVSATTRAPRPGEQDGREYYFVDVEEFDRRRQAEAFLEWAEVHGHYYGTPRSEVDRIHAAGHDAVLVIDVQGAAAVRQALSGAITVFVLPPSLDALERRLRRRDGSHPERQAEQATRLAMAVHEIEQYLSYDYVIVNDEFESAVAELEGIVRAERSRQPRRVEEAEAVLAAFRRSAKG